MDPHAPAFDATHRLSGFGVPIVSNVAIPGAVPDADQCGEAAVEVRFAVGAAADGAAPLWQRDGARLHFRPPGVAHFTITRDAIEVRGPADTIPDALDLLIATALPAVMWMRGLFMLHAAAVVLPGHDKAVAIAGVSGAGKSTLAAQCIDRGARLVADDSLAITAADRLSLAAGLPGGLFRVEGRARRFDPLDTDRRQAGAPLGVVIVIAPEASGRTMRRLGGVEAIEALLCHRHRPSIPALLGLHGQVMQAVVRIAAIVPVIEWGRRGSDEDHSLDALVAFVAKSRGGE